MKEERITDLKSTVRDVVILMSGGNRGAGLDLEEIMAAVQEALPKFNATPTPVA